MEGGYLLTGFTVNNLHKIKDLLIYNHINFIVIDHIKKNKILIFNGEKLCKYDSLYKKSLKEYENKKRINEIYYKLMENIENKEIDKLTYDIMRVIKNEK